MRVLFTKEEALNIKTGLTKSQQELAVSKFFEFLEGAEAQSKVMVDTIGVSKFDLHTFFSDCKDREPETKFEDHLKEIVAVWRHDLLSLCEPYEKRLNEEWTSARTTLSLWTIDVHIMSEKFLLTARKGGVKKYLFVDMLPGAEPKGIDTFATLEQLESVFLPLAEWETFEDINAIHQPQYGVKMKTVSVNAEEEKAMKKNNRYVVAVVIGSIVNMKQINAVKTWLTKNAKANVDIIVSGNPVRIQKLGKVIADMKVPARVIGCNVKNSDVFKYTHQDEHPCVWAINHSDVVFTIGDGMVVNKAKEYAFKTSRSCYNYGRQFVESICKGHYEKAVITRADIVTTNEAATATKQAVKEAADPMVAAKKELEVAKKEFEAAKAKLDAAQAKVDALAKPVEEKKEEVIEGRGAELFVDVELSPNMGAITAAAQDDYGYKSIAQEIEEAVNDDSDEILEAGENFAYGRTSYTVVTAFNITELEMAQMDSPDAARKIVEDAVANGSLKLAVPELISFEFEGKSYFIEDKEAFDMDIFDSCDAETQKMIIKESAAAGHIVAA